LYISTIITFIETKSFLLPISQEVLSEDCDDHLEPFVLSYTQTKASKNEPIAKQINSRAQLETVTDKIIDATELQP